MENLVAIKVNQLDTCVCICTRLYLRTDHGGRAV
jgi:hypothetical protein